MTGKIEQLTPSHRGLQFLPCVGPLEAYIYYKVNNTVPEIRRVNSVRFPRQKFLTTHEMIYLFKIVEISKNFASALLLTPQVVVRKFRMQNHCLLVLKIAHVPCIIKLFHLFYK